MHWLSRPCSADITIVTDARSNKVPEIAAAPAGEFAWYFPESRDQFRIAGRLTAGAYTRPLFSST
jgi:hypothetical protein